MADAEVLFRLCDADGDGVLTHAEAQRALQFLVPTPKGGGPKPAVHFACPAASDGAELRLPKEWFGCLYQNMT